MSAAPPTLYEAVGGEAGVRRLVARFYAIMDSEPRAAGIRAMHQADLATAQDKLFMFLSGWMGGPPLYVERYGHPMLRARHLPFSIGEDERDQWVYCMVRAMHDVGLEEKLMLQIGNALWDIADFMRNRNAVPAGSGLSG